MSTVERDQLNRAQHSSARFINIFLHSASPADRGSLGGRARHRLGLPETLRVIVGFMLLALFTLHALATTARPMATVTLAAHPRLILDANTLTTLRQGASANTPQWQALLATCNSYIGGTVNYPTGATYPDLPNVGQGYEGESYLPALMEEALCYQVLQSSNPTAAAPYGAEGVAILMAMSTPYTTGSGNEGENPCTDDGYPIRFYGVGFGLGYDWLYNLLTPAQRTQVYTAGNAWITAFEAPGGCAAFEFANPQSNYFAGYFHAKAVIALGTYDENPSGPAEWSDWLNNEFAVKVQPYYALHLLGGGWPEGFANYAALGILNMSLPAREVMTATGQNLTTNTAAPYSYPLDAANYAMHFTWPSLAYFDDRDTNHSNSTTQPPGTTVSAMYQQILGELTYWKSPEVGVFNQYMQAVNTANSLYGAGDPWLVFLEVNPNTAVTPINTLPLSFFAQGMGAVAARSDWGTGASWMSFRAGPYINNPGQGEEYFDQGSLALVRGSTPLLLNATGWEVWAPNGTAGENDVYNDNYGSFTANDTTQGNRRPYNIFEVRHMNGTSLVERFGQAAFTTEDNQVRTQITSFEDGSDYVLALATHLEDMYYSFNAGPAVAAWARQIVYLRPNRFVVYDRTTAGSAGSAGYDQFLAWHFPASPIAGTAPSGENRLDVTYNGQYAGAMTTVLPVNSTITNLPLYPDAAPVKAWQIQVRPANTNVGQQWLTVFDLSSSAATVATALPVTITQGAIVGVQLAASGGNSVVVSSSGAAGTSISGTIGYSVAAVSARHIITDLVPSTGYTIVATTSGSMQTIVVSLGGTTMSSPKGVLDFTEGASASSLSANFTDTISGLTVAFTDASTDPGGTIGSYAWTFGDGGTSTATNPSHSYAAAGTFSVIETVTDSASGKTSSKTASVTVTSTGGAPTANFTDTISGLTVTFMNASTDPGGTIGSYAWTFGDGSTSTVASPSHTYAASGTDSVTETVTDSVNGKTSAETQSVTVTGTAGSSQLFGNTGFESGVATPWSMTGGVDCSDSTCPEVAHTGVWYAGLNGWGTTHTDTLAQTATIPKGKTVATLQYYLHIDTAETTKTQAHDTLKVQILNSSGKVLSTLATYSNLNAAPGYTVHTSSLAAYIGQTITLKFTGKENASLQTSFVLDDITLTVQ